MFLPWIVAFGWLKKRMPTKWSAVKPRFNFITLHYTYVIAMTLIGSVIIYGHHNMDYVDALFFASGSATQSGLNTIDINKLHLYQQIVMMLFTSVCTPIFINTFVVFIRLYWFEKRFQNVVLEARSMRRTRTRSRTKSEAKADLDRDLGREEIGVGDREIRVLRKNEQTQNGEAGDGSTVKNDSDEADSNGKMATLETGGDGAIVDDLDEEVSPTAQRNSVPFRRDIHFADEVVQPPEEQEEQERFPERNNEKSIAFVENQRNPKGNATLRIPGPRDFDRGLVPEVIEDGDDLSREPTNVSDEKQYRHRRSNSVPATELSEIEEQEPALKPHITIDVPERRRPTTVPSAYNRAKSTDAVETGHTPATPTANMHLRNRSRTRSLGTFLSRNKEEEADPMPYLSWTPTLGRNSNFVDLNEDQREELGGIEYRALKLLAIILVCYYVGFHLLGMICLLPWIVRDNHYSGVVEEVGVSPVWWGFFTPASMFNDLGFTLTPDSMISFQFAPLVLLLGTFLIIIGNTGFPCMLRFVIWLCSKAVPHGSGVWEELRFLLDHPRRCFTLLFPSKANWWLFWVLILLNGIDLIFFVILDINDETVTALPPGFRFLDGLFQAAATRTAGFAVVNIAELHPAIQVSYLIMMYISIFPIAMSMRQTNVYEEKSLGVWADNDDDANSSYLSHHLRRQLSFDLWFVFLGFFLIAIVEGTRLENTNDYAFTLFSVLFEIVSAYGTVGLSLGYPGVNTSFSGEFRSLSKLIIIAMQIRGRHRGLPYALDRAILLPSESLHQKENEDATRRARRNSTVTERPEGLMRTGSGLSRTGSVITTGSGAPSGYRERFRPQKVRRFFAGALHAGPSIPREKFN